MKIINTPIYIDGNKIGRGNPVFIIAEMSGNHNQSLDHALKIVEAASIAGVQAIKLQTYTADTMTLDLKKNEFFISDKDNIWKGKSLYELYEQAHTPWEWHKPIMQRAKELGLVCFSTPFDSSSVDFLETLDVPAYKIASFENTDLSLIQKVAKTGKPVIVSTGMASLSEIDEIVRTLRKAGCEKFILLQCTSTYPATPEDSNILTIPNMREIFNCEVGLSDHTMGVGVSVAAVSHGATVVEKHFTLNRSDGGVDSVFSIEPDEMKQLVVEVENARLSVGSIKYGPTEAEKMSIKFRRSIYVSEDIQIGGVITSENIRCIRPGNGIPPKYYKILLGKKVTKYLKKGTPVSWSIF
jgi:pseudaminic acid synthase